MLLRRLSVLSRVFMVAVLATLGVQARANPEYLELFLSHYHVSDTSPLADKNCTICHVSDEDHHFNAYGEDVHKALETQTGGKFTWQTLAYVEPLDSNGDGKTNLQNIIANEGPGDPVKIKAGVPVPPPPPAPVRPRFIPKHAFHPAIVHFPIALIFVAFFLDLFAIVLKKPALHKMAGYNLWMGLISAVAALISGVGVMTFKQLPYKGLILEHIIMAVSCTVMVIFSLIFRLREGKVWMILAFLTLLAATVFVANAGHFGGQFVYGE